MRRIRRFHSPSQLGSLAVFVATTILSLLFPISYASAADLRATIDSQVGAMWKEQNLKPAGHCDDATFVRRLYLDLVGTIPTHAEAKAFIEDGDAAKRTKLIDKLLDDPRYAQNQALTWDLVMFGRSPANPDATRKRDRFRAWLTDKFAKNTPHDQWVRDLLMAEEEGSELYYVQFANKPEDLTESFTKTFLGTQLGCARCHDHPFTDLTQQDFYGMAGFFVRLVTLDQGAGPDKQKRYKIGEKSSGEVLFAGNVKDLKPGAKGEPVAPRFLLAEAALQEPPLPAGFKEVEVKTGLKEMPKPAFSRKEKLAEWSTAPNNPYFARATVNRVWGQFFGRGIVHPVNDLGEGESPSIQGLLDTLTKEFAAKKFDLKWLIREIVNTEVYQLSSRGSGTEALPKYFDRARIRPLTAEEIMASLKTATGYDPNAKQGGDAVGTEYFLRYFGEPVNGQGDFQGSLSEHLFLNNSGNVRDFVSKKKGNLTEELLASTEPWEQRVERMFYAVLSRPPTATERERFVAHLTRDPKADPLVEEALWVLFNLSEFRFNH